MSHDIILTDDRGAWTSASNAAADSLCPGRHQLCQQVSVEQAPSRDAAMGTRIHGWLAGEDLTLTDEEQEVANVLRKRAADITEAWCQANGFTARQAEEAVVIREQRFWADHGPYRHSGKPDHVVIVGAGALILDYKTGRNEVTGNAGNLQLRDLAVLVGRHQELGVARVTVAIVPAFGQVGPMCEYSQAELVRANMELGERLAKVHDPDALRVPGPVQCKYCKAKSICPELAVGASLPVATAATIAGMASDKLGQFLKLLRLADEAADAEVRRRLEAGQTVPGWKFAPGRETEKITDPGALAQRWLEAGGRVEQLMPAVSIAKGKLAKAIGGAFNAKGQERDAMLRVLTEGITETSTSAPVLKED